MATTSMCSMWRRLPISFSLRDCEVHIWRGKLDLPQQELRYFERTLSIDERSRAGKFYFAQDYGRFVAAHGFLREVLSRYLGCDPSHLGFRHEATGKPRLTTSFSGSRVHFNLSHSGGLALVAVSIGREVGVDVEYIRHVDVDDFFVKELFSKNEAQMLRSVPPLARTKAFLSAWTRKEAIGKARGCGLLDPSTILDVSPEQNDIRTVLKDSCWAVRPLDVAPGYVAAVAASGTDWNVKLWYQTTFISAPLCTPSRLESDAFVMT